MENYFNKIQKGNEEKTLIIQTFVDLFKNTLPDQPKVDSHFFFF